MRPSKPLSKIRYAALSKPSEKKLKLDDGVEEDCQPDDQVVPSSPEGPLFNGTDGSLPLIPLGDTSLSSSKPDVLPRISVRELYSHLISSSNAVLVLDCRARADYNSSHPDSKKFPQWVSVPEETVRKGCVWSRLMLYSQCNLHYPDPFSHDTHFGMPDMSG